MRGVQRVTWRFVSLLTGLEKCRLAQILSRTVSAWQDDKVPRLSAALAFYALLSSAPLVIIIVAVAAVAYGPEAARGQLVWDISGFIGTERARVVQELIQSANKPFSGLAATSLGLLTLAVGASSVVIELRDALNTIWHVPVAVGARGISGLVRLVKERCYSIGLVLGGGLLLLLSLAVNASLATIGESLGSLMPSSEVMLQAITLLMSLVVSAFLFATVYKALPDVSLHWKDVIVGGSVTALLFEAGKQLIGLYLGRTTLGSTYGAAGSLVLLLVWVYYSAQVFFLGAEFTKIYIQSRQTSRLCKAPSEISTNRLPQST